MFDYHDGFGFGHWGFGIFFWLLIFIFLLWAFKGTFSGGQSNSNESPHDILKKRYARGEISKEQYEQMKKDIES